MFPAERDAATFHVDSVWGTLGIADIEGAAVGVNRSLRGTVAAASGATTTGARRFLAY
jgi:hypothetical protein